MSRSNDDLRHEYALLRVIALVLDDGPWLADLGLESIAAEADSLSSYEAPHAAPEDAVAQAMSVIEQAEELVHYAAATVGDALVLLAGSGTIAPKKEVSAQDGDLLMVLDRFLRLQSAR